MKKNVKLKPKQKIQLQLFIGIFLLGILLIVVLSFQHNILQKNSTKFNSQVTSSPELKWVLYENKEVGFKLEYPSSWGKPKFSLSKGNQGVSYELNFAPGPEYLHGVSRNMIMVRFDSDDYATIGEFNRTLGPYASKSIIEHNLSVIKGDILQSGTATFTYLYHDKDSYATLLDNITPGSTNVMEAFKIVSLPKINVSGVAVSYMIVDRPDYCAKSQLSSNDKQWCMTFEINDDLKRVLSSIQQL